MKEILERIGKSIVKLRSIYPDALIKEIKIGKTKIRAYGEAGGNWFKIIYDTRDDKVRVHSSSRTIEYLIKKRLSKKS